jgi:hypothetical protein
MAKELKTAIVFLSLAQKGLESTGIYPAPRNLPNLP